MSLRNQTIKSFFWQSFGTFGSGLVGLLITMFLARHLNPTDFGVIEVILSFVVISEVLIDSGFTQSIIKEKNINNHELTGVFIINFGVATLIYLILYLLAPFISSFFKLADNFVNYFRILNIKLIVDAISFCQVANCMRQMRFNILAQTSLFGISIAALLSFVFIHVGYGIWALVAFYLSQSIFKAIFILIKVKWHPSLSPNFSKIYDFIKFGGNIMILQIIDKTITSFESLCIGKKYSRYELGNFSQSRKLDSMIIQTLLSVVQKVSYPALAKIDNPLRLKMAYAEIMQLSLWVVFPIAVFCFFFPDLVIISLFGPSWDEASTFLKFFAIYSMLFPIQAIGMNIFMVKNRTALLRNISFFNQIIRIILIITLINFSIYIFTAGVVGIAVLGGALYLYYGGHLINYSIIEIIRDNLKTIITTVSIGILLKYSYIFKGIQNITVQTMALFLTFGISYILISIITHNKAWIITSKILASIFSKIKQHI